MSRVLAMVSDGFSRLLGMLFSAAAWVLTGARPVWFGCSPKAVQRIYFANHASHGDAVLIWSTMPADLRIRTRPVAGADYWQKSAPRRYVAAQVFNVVLVNRPGSSTQLATNSAAKVAGKTDPPARDLLAPIKAALELGDSLILFPEGTRNTGEEQLLPLKSGLYRLGKAYPSVELVPVWIDNIRRVLPKGELLPVPMLCSVTFGAPLDRVDGEGKESFLARARDAMLALRTERD